MTFDDILSYLNRNLNDTTFKVNAIYKFKKNYGVRVTELRALAKEIGYNEELSMMLSEIDSYDTYFLSVLLEDPKNVSLARITELAVLARQSSLVDQALCELIMSSDHLQEVIKSWFHHPDDNLRYAFYQLYGTHLRKSPLDQIDHDFSISVLSKIKERLKNEEVFIQNAMNNTVVMAGLHVPSLVDKAYEVARYIGYVTPIRNQNDCNMQSALAYLDRYITQPKFSRVAKIKKQH